MDDRTARLVQGVVRRGSRSLLQYVGEASPWSGAEDRDTLDRLRQLIREDQEALTALVRFLGRRRVPPPYLGAYPEHFTTLNFVSLDRLLPLLVVHERQEVAALEGDVAAVSDAETAAALRDLLGRKRGHLAALEELRKTHPQVGLRV
jgi:hypothetical protein